MTTSGDSPWDRLWSLLDEVVVDDLDREVWLNLASHVDFRGRSLLELGCGRGLLSRFAFAAGARSATLVDRAPEALRIARGLLADAPGAEFVQSDVLGYEGGRRFDIVLSSGLLEHFEENEVYTLGCDLSGDDRVFHSEDKPKCLRLEIVKEGKLCIIKTLGKC